MDISEWAADGEVEELTGDEKTGGKGESLCMCGPWKGGHTLV